MRIDHDQQQIFCSVGDLIHEATYRRIGVERGDGFRRMWIGQDIHHQRAEERAETDPNYRSELCVSFRSTVREWDITISGRIDGISIDKKEQTVLLEEVKSLHFDLELEGLYRSEKLQRHLYQLMLYALFLSKEGAYAGFSFRPQLVLIDVSSGSTEIVDAPFDPEDVISALEASLHALIDRVETDHALLKAKRAFAEGLQFPYGQMRPFQKEMVDAVGRTIQDQETLLVSAPTGVGKTIAALYPALRESLRLGKKLFFLTSKTLQQEIAVEALKMLNDGSFRTLRVRAKQKMCAHTEVICHEDFCPYAARYSEKMSKNNLIDRLTTDMSYFDPDITFEISKSAEVCPFEVSLELIEGADVIVCDYNYIFDPYVGLKAYQQDKDYGDCVLIIDEAHNLVDRGRGYFSPELHESAIEAVRNQLLMRPGCELDGWEDLLAELRAHLHQLAEALGDQGGATQSLCEPDRKLFLRHRGEWERLLMRYIAWKIERRIADEDDPLIDFYFKLIKFTNLLNEQGDEFASIIEQAKDGLKVKIFCKDPSRFLGDIISSAHAVIAISATLQPFEFYQTMLGFPSKRTATLSLPSPFPRDNRKIVVIPEVDTTWKERANHYDRIASTVAEMAGSARGNFLALFPSYAFLQQVSAKLPILHKNLMVQRSDMTDYERRHLLDTLRETPGEGHLILAVSGGMYAEGIDYQGDMLSGVFVVGPALPAVSFEQELLKRYFDELHGAGFEYAYLIPGMTRVVQSAGRVIRSETDIGVIALMCRRFTQESYTRFFPPDWYVTSPRELVSKKPVEEIRTFFEARRTPQLRIRY